MSTGIDGGSGILSDFTRGTTKKFTLTEDNGLDITGGSFHVVFTSTREPEDPPLLELTVTSLSNPSSGIAEITIPASMTLDLNPGVCYYSIRFLDPSGGVWQVDKAKISIYQAFSEKVS